MGMIVVNTGCVCVCAAKGVCTRVVEGVVMVEGVDFVRSGVVGFTRIIPIIIPIIIHKVFTTKSGPAGPNEAGVCQHPTNYKVGPCSSELIESLVDLEHLGEGCMFV